MVLRSKFSNEDAPARAVSAISDALSRAWPYKSGRSAQAVHGAFGFKLGVSGRAAESFVRIAAGVPGCAGRYDSRPLMLSANKVVLGTTSHERVRSHLAKKQTASARPNAASPYDDGVARVFSISTGMPFDAGTLLPLA